MTEYVGYEIAVSDEKGPLMNAHAEKYNELVYETLGYLDETDSDLFFFTLIAITKSGKTITLCNIRDAVGPISKKNMINILVSFSMFTSPEDSAIFDGTISKCGNSYVIKVTEQCRQMRLDIGDQVRIKMEKIKTASSKDNVQKIFYRKDTKPINKDRIYVDQPEYLDKFLADYRIKGAISLKGIEFDRMMDHIIDHEFAVRNADGDVILVSIPYNSEGEEEYARSFADAHGLNYDYINEYSWYHRGDTKLVIFWLKDVELKRPQ